MHDSCYAATGAEEPVITPPGGSKGWSINRMSESIHRSGLHTYFAFLRAFSQCIESNEILEQECQMYIKHIA